MIDVAISEHTNELFSKAIAYKEANGIKSDLLFAKSNKDDLPQYCSIRWKKYLKACGLDERIVPHSLRIYGITDLCRRGETDEHIMLVSGHTTEEGLRRYKKFARDMKQGVITANNRSMNE